MQVDFTRLGYSELTDYEKLIETLNYAEADTLKIYDNKPLRLLSTRHIYFRLHKKLLEVGNIEIAEHEVVAQTFSLCNSYHIILNGLGTPALAIDALFSDCSAKKIECYNLTAHKVITLGSIFLNCKHTREIIFKDVKCEKALDMSGLFNGCCKLEKPDIQNINTGTVQNMNRMFCDCESLTDLDLTCFDTKSLVSASRMFYNCKSLEYLDISSFTCDDLAIAYKMFYGCRSLKYLNLSKFGSYKLEDMRLMFCNCCGLEELDLHGLHPTSETMTDRMFECCCNLKRVRLPDNEESREIFKKQLNLDNIHCEIY